MKTLLHQYREEIKVRSEGAGDMRLHLMPLFDFVRATKPQLIVELGVRGGNSTFALERGARMVKAKMIAVDRDDCIGACDFAEFVQSDDLEFAQRFESYCAERAMYPIIDLLMIDTEHTYEQTKAEVEAWLPFLAPQGVIIFHDTNCQPFYFGVAEFIRTWLEIPFPEDKTFTKTAKGWIVHHNPDCFGLTTIWRRAKSNGH